MSVLKGQMDVVTTALILLEVICVSVWMDMNWSQIITLVQVITTYSGISIMYVAIGLNFKCIIYRLYA